VSFLSGGERQAIYSPIFGASDDLSAASSDFSRARDDLLRASTAVVDRANDSAISELSSSVIAAQQSFRDYLLSFHGDSVRFSKDTALSEMTERACYPILRDKAIAAVFGVSGTPSEDYPYAADSVTEMFIEQLASQLTFRVDKAQTRLPTSRVAIRSLQRTAIRGAEAIAAIIEFDSETDSDDSKVGALIVRCYEWRSALIALKASTGQPSSAPIASSVQAPAALS
jgi:hypothetical protein